MVEDMRFELMNRLSRLHAFQACAFNRSANPPNAVFLTRMRLLYLS